MAQLRLFLYVLLGTEYPRTPAHPDYHEQPDVKVQHHSTVSAEETFYKTPCHSNVMFKFLVLLFIHFRLAPVLTRTRYIQSWRLEEVHLCG